MRSRQLSSGPRHRRATAIAAAVAAVGLLGSGCSLANFNLGSEPAEELPPPPELSTPSLPEGVLSGTWRGTYTCPQGRMRLSLTLDQRTRSTVTGIFRFAPGPGTTGARSGSFTIRGTVTGTHLVMRGNSWIDRPGDYEMVSLSARLSTANPDRIRGDIRSPGCGTFIVERS